MIAVIRAVFFDFGGVILSSPFDAFTSYEQRSGLPPGFLRLVNSTNPDTNAWAQLERSEVDVTAFVPIFEAEALELGHAVDGREVLGCLIGELRPAMVRAVERCAEIFTTALLTNNVLGAAVGSGHQTRPHEDVLAMFHHIVESSKVGVRKPDPRFYQMACELAGVTPTEVVFLDDLGINLKPARTMGMTTIKVADPAAAISELQSIVGIDLS